MIVTSASEHDGCVTASTPTARMMASHASATSSATAKNTTDNKEKVAKYKEENKKLRKEVLMLKVELEAGLGFDQEDQLESSLMAKETADLRCDVSKLQEQCDHLVFQLGQQKEIDNEEIVGLQNQLVDAKNEVAEITLRKDAEIEALKTQLNKAYDQLHSSTNIREEGSPLDNNQYHHGIAEGDTKQQNDDDDFSSSDVSQLQSIITMMRQAINNSHHEREVLEQRLQEEMDRSQMELQAFAKTLEGVDDLRISAETMAREIRRIKVKGYRPTRSDLLMSVGVGESGEVHVRDYGELTAAVEASESMEHAIHLIEGMNNRMEERRRAAVAAYAASSVVTIAESVAAANASIMATTNNMPSTRPRISPLRDDDDEGGGFTSFWKSVAVTPNDDNDGEKKKKKHKRKPKKRTGGGGSVITSFF
jgi:hypothetical protein